MKKECFAVSTPGLESITSNELIQLGLLKPSSIASTEKIQKKSQGGVSFKGNLREIYLANLHLRTASRIIVRLDHFIAKSFPELVKKTALLDWENFLTPGQPLSVRVTSRNSTLYHSDAIANRIAAAISSKLHRPSALIKHAEDNLENPPQIIIVRMINDHLTISIDSSGEILHKRGYRQEITKAPIRETLAAGMILAAGWDPALPLIDPFCGSGTIPIEAALIAQNTPPGIRRKFAFMNWPSFDPSLWDQLIEEGQKNLSDTTPLISGSDRDAGAIKIASSNADRAGVSDKINWSQNAFSAIEPASIPGWIVTNPPYGIRASSNQDLRNLFAQLGHVLHERFIGWNIAILSTDDHLLSQTKINFTRGVWLDNGGIKVKLSIGKIS